jgi:hypothetical protein
VSDVPSGTEALILWRLALAGGGDWKKEVKPGLDGPMAKRLRGAGLIEEEKRCPDGSNRKLLFVTLTDRGWQWLGEHLDAPIATRSPAALGVFVRLLARLQAHLPACGLSLAEFIQSTTTPDKSTASNPAQQIEAAYLRLSGGRPNERVRLSDLRDALPNLPRTKLDTALLSMASTGAASLYRLDNPLEIGPRDRDAVLRTPSGEERHLVYLGGRAS